MRTLSPATTSRSSPPTTKRSRPETTVAICSFTWWCSGTSAPAASVMRARVIPSPFSICRPMSALSCSTGWSSQRWTSTSRVYAVAARSRKLTRVDIPKGAGMGYAVVDVDEIPYVWGTFKMVRHHLGATAFGFAQIDFPADKIGSEHDEAESGQEEVYVTLSGG